MKYKSAMTTQASGSVDGMTASRNRFGRYMRSRAVPVNPQTAQQVAIRSLFAMYSTQWGGLLTPAQRATWNLYGANVPVTDKLGDQVNLTGANWYVGLNVPRSQADPVGLPALAAGPAIFDQGSMTPPTLTSVTAATSVAVIAFTDADPWTSEDEAAMLIYASRPQSPSVDFFKGPYRLAGVLLGDSGTPITTPQDVTIPFPAVAGQVVHFAAQVTRADGRLAPRVTFRGTAA